MTNNTSTYALTKSVDRFPEYPQQRKSSEMANRPNYPIEHRSRRSSDE